MYGTGHRLPPHIVTADTVASFVKGINSLGAHLLLPDFDCSDCSFFICFLLRAAISAFHIALLSLHHSVFATFGK